MKYRSMISNIKSGILKFLYNKRYFIKLSLIYFFISCFLILLLSLIFDDIYTSISRNYFYDEEQQRSLKIAAGIEKTMKDYLDLANELAGNDDVMRFFQDHKSTDVQIMADTTIKKYFLYKKGEEEIHLLSADLNRTISTGYLPNIYQYKNWGIIYRLANSTENHLYFSSLYRGLSGDTICLSVAVKVYDTQRKVIGYIIVDIYRNRIQRLLYQVESVQTDLKITNSGNYIVFSNEDRYKEGSLYSRMPDTDYNHTFAIPLLGGAFTLNYEIKNTILYQMKEKIQNKVFLLIMFSIISSMITAFIISSGLRRPINMLINAMKSVGRGNLDTQIDLNKRNDLHELQDEFNKLVRKLKRLQEENIENERLMHQAQIAFLQAQIRPHFLYNMLATIKGMLSYRSSEEVGEAIVKLTKLLRNSFDFSNELRTLRDHLSIVRYYVDLQNLRFMNKFKLSVTADVESLDCRMPPLLIQPLVENAIIHGLEEKTDNCRIDISARSEGKYVVIKISDNGTGIPEDIIESLESDVKNGSDASHIGLSNVINRIRYFYDDSCYFKIEREIREGTLIEFKIKRL